MAQWSEQSSLAAHICGPVSTSGVDTICASRVFFFFGYSGFPLSLKTNTSKFQFDLERTDTPQRVLLSAPWVNKSQQVTNNNFYSHEN